MASVSYQYSPSGGFEIVLCRDAARRFPWHLHAAHEVAGAALSGGLVLETPFGARRIRTGECFRIPRLRAHRLTLDPGTTLLTVCRASAPAAATVWRLSAARAVCAGLCPDCREQPLCARLLDTAPLTENLPAATPIQSVCSLLLSDPATPRPLARLAALTGYSPWHFLRRFRQNHSRHYPSQQIRIKELATKRHLRQRCHHYFYFLLLQQQYQINYNLFH